MVSKSKKKRNSIPTEISHSEIKLENTISQEPSTPEITKHKKQKCSLSDLLNESIPGQITNNPKNLSTSDKTSDSPAICDTLDSSGTDTSIEEDYGSSAKNEKNLVIVKKPEAASSESKQENYFLTLNQQDSLSSPILKQGNKSLNSSILIQQSSSLISSKPKLNNSSLNSPILNKQNSSLNSLNLKQPDYSVKTPTLQLQNSPLKSQSSLNSSNLKHHNSSLMSPTLKQQTFPQSKLESVSRLNIVTADSCPSNPIQEELTILRMENSQLKKEIQALKSSASKLKSGLYCTICLNYYHVPHGIDCGHVFCFSCIRSWLKSLVAKTSKLECPLCRHSITKVPNLVLTLHHHLLELLQEDFSQHSLVLQSIKEHFVCFQEENDKWSSIFPKCGIRTTIYDAEDDVERCTTCNWEVHGKVCSNCNAAYSGASEEEHSDSATSVSEDNSDGSLDGSLSNLIPESEHGSPARSNHLESDNESADSFVCKDDEVDYDSDHKAEAISCSDSESSIKNEPDHLDDCLSVDSDTGSINEDKSKNLDVTDFSDKSLKKREKASSKGQTSVDNGSKIEIYSSLSEASEDIENSPIFSKGRVRTKSRYVMSDSE